MVQVLVPKHDERQDSIQRATPGLAGRVEIDRIKKL